ncbi:DegT/DnrJ/EryC1/StrS family aminotransferase [Dethiobacter alkaliphilus]|uniref:DegT/DnrJ/EryC1/StrS family aminotransferase n=1 Tax=Dethiobacter alkaliphilus TaxID=427926 RepID=UPI0022278734|nr:DegT/DnrJ/EryC1/StrS aminotransferase family protein [Dethiobacter alkaliphilus]MCW3489274.1 DegT/DnrJ/EryC1/StrS aminotransferase family protein [Dethiobacter alkaliphilus]
MIPFSRLCLGDEEKKQVLKVLNSGQLAAGKEVAAFEKEFARFMGTEFAVATNNGTSALHTALLAAGVKPGDKVITTPFTFAATAASILHCGAIPVFADIDPHTLNIDPAKAESLIRQVRPKAVIVVHLFGTPCDMAAFALLVKKYNLILIEDCAQAHGAKYSGQTVGSFGHAAVFSFYATKNMTTGEGGMVVTNNEGIYDRAALLINHGTRQKYRHEELGYNYRMTEISAAIGRIQLKKLSQFTDARRNNARTFTDCLQKLNDPLPPFEPKDTECVYHHYTVRSLRRDRLRLHMEQSGIQCGINYPVPLHRQPVFQRFARNLPEAEQAGNQVLSLPVHPGLSAADREKICQALRSFSP